MGLCRHGRRPTVSSFASHALRDAIPFAKRVYLLADGCVRIIALFLSCCLLVYGNSNRSLFFLSGFPTGFFSFSSVVI